MVIIDNKVSINNNLYNAFKYFNIFRKIFGLTFQNEDLTITFNIIKNNIHEKLEIILIKSFINRYTTPYKSIPYSKFIEYLQKLNKIPYRDNTNKLKDEILQQTSDNAQIISVNRIISRKPFTPVYKTLNEIRNNNKSINNKSNELGVWKQCPHCTRRYFRDNNTTYIICGYADSSSGYDWKGCSKDWCFKCGKKLCKNWNIDHLYDKKNRYHNNKCCKSHAIKHNNKYPEDYCQLLC